LKTIRFSPSSGPAWGSQCRTPLNPVRFFAQPSAPSPSGAMRMAHLAHRETALCQQTARWNDPCSAPQCRVGETAMNEELSKRQAISRLMREAAFIFSQANSPDITPALPKMYAAVHLAGQL